MKLFYTFLFCFCSFYFVVFAQCPTCGNGVIDIGETNTNCPQDVPRSATCTSPCGQPKPYETTVGVRVAYDFTGTTTYGTASLPSGWSFAGAPLSTSSGSLPAADVFGAKAGLVQPNCSGSCTSTNFFCIGNLASSSVVGAGGSNGKLGANFDGRTNVSQNLSYAVLRGAGNPTLVSETFNFSSVEGFKIQFWLFPSETSCGQSNSWGSCTGNQAYLDFSTNGTSWTQILQMNTSSTNSDMCTSNTSNTFWMKEGSWSRVCLTVFKSTTSPGNFYSAASSSTAASGIMVSSTWFSSGFRFRIRYAQSASCTSSPVANNNPGRYLAIDYPVITSGNEMIPCGISFSNMCGYGADNNDDGVGSSTGTTTATAFGTTKRSQNQAERGVEIFSSQNASFAVQNNSGSNTVSNYELCNAEGGDKQCIDWESNNNNYFSVYECITDWEAPNIKLSYYKGTSPQSFDLTKITTAGRTPTVGWRYAGNRFVSCGSLSDLNPGCNGYLFSSNSLPIQFPRTFYQLGTNNLGQSWSFYGPTSCIHYFNGPFLSPIERPLEVSGVTHYVTCNSSDKLVFTGLVAYCTNSSGFSGSPTLSITGPGGFSDSFNSGALGSTVVTQPGDYVIQANTPNTPAQCINCSKVVCVTLSQAEIDGCTPLAAHVMNLTATLQDEWIHFTWNLDNLHESNLIFLEQGNEQQSSFQSLKNVSGLNQTSIPASSGKYVYRLAFVGKNGKTTYSNVVEIEKDFIIKVYPNPASRSITIETEQSGNVEWIGVDGNIQWINTLEKGKNHLFLPQTMKGIYQLRWVSSRTAFTRVLIH